jgi:hypothetical protein
MAIRAAVILFFIGFLFWSCKKDDPVVEPPVEETDPQDEENPEEDPDTTSVEVVQRVLLEHLTGFKSANCPQAHSIAQNLQTFYSGQLIEVRIHSSQFAVPTGMTSEDPYHTDFSTPAGNIYYEEFFNSPGVPTGGVNRMEHNASVAVNPGFWNQAIEPMINLTPRAELIISVNSYNESTRQVDFDVEMEVIANLNPGAYYMTAYLVEDSIYDWQLNNETDQENYLHRHVLRDNVNGTWGSLAFNSGVAGQENTLNFQYTLDAAWKEEHCSLVVYLYHEDTRKIVQVNKAPVIP